MQVALQPIGAWHTFTVGNLRLVHMRHLTFCVCSCESRLALWWRLVSSAVHEHAVGVGTVTAVDVELGRG
jgi:hypothetical protein